MKNAGVATHFRDDGGLRVVTIASQIPTAIGVSSDKCPEREVRLHVLSSGLSDEGSLVSRVESRARKSVAR